MSKLKSVEELFAGRHLDRAVIILCVSWYLRYKLSRRDLVEKMGECGLQLAHTTNLRWVRQQSLTWQTGAFTTQEVLSRPSSLRNSRRSDCVSE